MKYTLFFILTILVLSCREAPKTDEKARWLKVKIEFPKCIEKALIGRFETDPDVKTFAIAFNLSVDSSRFVISNVNSLEFALKYPPTYYTFIDNRCIFIYSGMEGLLKSESVNVPDEIMQILLDRQDKLKNRMVEPFHVQYRYPNFDNCELNMVFDTIEFNSYLPNTVRLYPIK